VYTRFGDTNPHICKLGFHGNELNWCTHTWTLPARTRGPVKYKLVPLVCHKMPPKVINWSVIGGWHVIYMEIICMRQSTTLPSKKHFTESIRWSLLTRVSSSSFTARYTVRLLSGCSFIFQCSILWKCATLFFICSSKCARFIYLCPHVKLQGHMSNSWSK